MRQEVSFLYGDLIGRPSVQVSTVGHSAPPYSHLHLFLFLFSLQEELVNWYQYLLVRDHSSAICAAEASIGAFEQHKYMEHPLEPTHSGSFRAGVLLVPSVINLKEHLIHMVLPIEDEGAAPQVASSVHQSVCGRLHWYDCP